MGTTTREPEKKQKERREGRRSKEKIRQQGDLGDEEGEKGFRRTEEQMREDMEADIELKLKPRTPQLSSKTQLSQSETCLHVLQRLGIWA